MCHPEFHHCYDPKQPYTCDEQNTTQGGSSTGSNQSGSSGGGGEDAESAGGSQAVTTTDGGSAGASALACQGQACLPEITTLARLPALCAGDRVELELSAGCGCDVPGAARGVHWSSVDKLPLGLSLSSDGTLSGTAPPGRHSFKLQALVDEQPIARTFELEVDERCFLLFAAEDAATGAAYLGARWLGSEGPGTGEPLRLEPPDNPPSAELTRFDLSPDGRFAATVVTNAAVESLHLFEFEASAAEYVELGASGAYVAHAFSRDSRWLARVTSDSMTPATTTLELVDLHADPVTVIDSGSIGYLDGLSWSPLGRVLYYGEPDPNDPYFYAIERGVSEAGLGDEWLIPASRIARNVENADTLLDGFVVNELGVLSVYTTHIAYLVSGVTVPPAPPFDGVGSSFFHETPLSVSPGLEWMANDVGPDMRLDPLGTAYNFDEPYATAQGCAFVLAWSENGRKFLCSDDTEVSVFDTSSTGGELQKTPLLVSGGLAGPSDRVAFSASGAWLALVPSDAGLVVVSAADFASRSLDTPTLARPTSGTNEWDFFFTSGEDKLIVQRGRELDVIDLTSDPSAPAYPPLETRLPLVPVCTRSWKPDPRNWCGSPYFRGNLVLSPTEAQLAFADEDRSVKLAELDSGEVSSNLGTLTASCTERCIQFQRASVPR